MAKKHRGRVCDTVYDSDGELEAGVTEDQYIGGSQVPVARVRLPPPTSPSKSRPAASRQPSSASVTPQAPSTPPVVEASLVKQSRWKKTSVTMEEFKTRRDDILDCIFSTEFDSHAGSLCYCGRPGAAAIFRCIDCMPQPSTCSECLCRAHKYLPFHQIQQWTGLYFRRWSLDRCGLRLCLGHNGDRCPRVSESVVGSAFTVVDTNGIHALRIVYCRCAGAAEDPYQLLLASLYPATWEIPHTVFTFRLLKHYHLDSLQSRKPAYDYWAVIRRLTDNTRSDGLPVRYEELLRVSRQWRCLMRMKRSGQSLGISQYFPDNSKSVAVICPACPQPGFNMPENWKEFPPHKNALFLGIDGNFRAVLKLKRHDFEDQPLLDGLSYFAPSEPYKVYEKSAKTDPQEHKSTCSNLRSMNMVTNRKGVIISGIVAVVCVRHSCYCVNGMVDMSVGEKFALLDYALSGALSRNTDPDILRFLMCDKGCQYGVNLLSRFQDTFPHLAHLVEWLIILINKMHLQGHKEDCRFRFSPQYTCSCGRTDGEGVERPWPHSNETAKITQDQNPGHRKDTFDDTNGDWNYRKLISMSTSLLDKLRAAYKNLSAAEENFSRIAEGLNPELIAEWEKMSLEPWLEDGVWRSVYRAEKDKMPKYADLVTALTEAEEQDAKKAGNLRFEKTFCATAFLAAALDLEQAQTSLLEFAATVSETASREQRHQLCLKRGSLREDITNFRKLQQIHMPQLGEMPEVDYEMEDEVEEFGIPESEGLDLPSGLGDLVKFKLEELGKREYLLRRGAADRALSRLKAAILRYNQHLTFKEQNVRGYGPNTRAEATVAANRKDIDRHANIYRRHYRAMTSLGLAADDRRKFQTLTEQDLTHLHVSAKQPQKLGESQLPQAWFWGGDRDADEARQDEQESLEQLTREEQRVRWFRTRVHRDRCREEVDIVHAELERTTLYFGRMQTIWTSVAGNQSEHEDKPSTVRHGRQAYAHKQSAIYAQRGREASRCQTDALRLQAGEVIGAKRGADGRTKEPASDAYVWSYY